MRSARSWRRGRGGGPARRRWRCARGSCLLAAEGLNEHRDRAAARGASPRRSTKWRKRFAEHRLDGLIDEPRPGQPRKITDEQVEEVIVKTLETTPEGRDALVDAVDGRARSA